MLKGSRVILYTLSMLSHPKLASFTRLVPIETVVVDEASQIKVGNELPMLFGYSTTLRKLVFIGDEKQCKRSRGVRSSISSFLFLSGAQGQDNLGNLKSIFEMGHEVPYPLPRYTM